MHLHAYLHLECSYISIAKLLIWKTFLIWDKWKKNRPRIKRKKESGLLQMMDDSFFIIAIFLYSTLVIMISFYRYYIDISFLIMIYAQTVNQILLQKNSVSINYTVNFVSNYNISIIHYSNDISKKKKRKFRFHKFSNYTFNIFNYNIPII